MKATERTILKMAILAGMALGASVGAWAQSSAPAGGTTAGTTPTSTTSAAQAPAGGGAPPPPPQPPPAKKKTTSEQTPQTAQPAAGTTPVGGDAPAPAKVAGLRNGIDDDGEQHSACSLRDRGAPGKNADKKDKKEDKVIQTR